MPKPSIAISRSGRSILSFQLQGLCNVLRVAVQAGQPPGAATVAFLIKMRNDMLTVVSGCCVDGLPEVGESISSVDMLTYAEILNETLNAFLSPEEGEEKRRFFGLDQVAVGLGPFSVGFGRPA